MKEKKFNWMKILKTGTFIDKNGVEVKIDEAKLDKVVEATDLSSEPQFVVEHPVFDKLGYGTIEKIKRVGDALYVLPKFVEEKFKQVVNKGELPGRSVRLNKNTLALEHIGFLPPEVSPAVDGLGAYAFSQDNDSDNYSFSLPGVESHFAEVENDKIDFAQFEVSSHPFNAIKSLFRGIKNYLIEAAGLEKANEIMNDWSIDETGNAPTLYEKAVNPNYYFSQNIIGDEMKIDLSKIDFSKPDQVKAAVTALLTENQELTNNLNTAKTDLQAAQQTISAEQAAKNRKEVLDFCESEEMKLKITPAEKEKIVALLLATKANGVIELSAPDAGNKTQINAYELLKEQLKQMPDKIDLSELAKNGKAAEAEPDYVKTAKSIAAFVK